MRLKLVVQIWRTETLINMRPYLIPPGRAARRPGPPLERLVSPRDTPPAQVEGSPGPKVLPHLPPGHSYI
jgi:hypothetical protein